MHLKDKVVLITGASRGIGAAAARLASEEGAKVVVNYNTGEEAAQKVASELKSESLSIKADITKTNEIQNFVQEIIDKWGRIDVLINNAGMYIDGNLTEHSTEQIDMIIDVNLRGTIQTTRIVLPHMLKQKDNVIVNISSRLGKKGGSGAVVYSASKFGVIGFTQALGRELRRDNIRVYAVCPGLTATDMGDFDGMPPEKVAQRIIDCAKETLGLETGGDTEIYS